jgi:dipeptidyl aminopeptidase/acylaminoacyl peptidase
MLKYLPMSLNKKRILIFSAVFIGVPAVAFLIIKLAQGYKPDFSTKTFRPTGLLVAASIPDGAQVFVNGKLKTATDDTINLSPDTYEVEIKKDGFFPWKKMLTIKKELVTETNAQLFSAYPDLKVLTFTGAANPLLSPDGQKVAFSVATASASKRGLWVLDLTDRPLGLSREPRQILQSAPAGRNFSLANFEWSPDSKQLLVMLRKEIFLVDTARLTPATSLIDVGDNLTLIKRSWENESKLKHEAKISKLPKELLEVLADSVKDIWFSPDETKILYTATASASIPEEIISPLPAASTQSESRQIEPGKVYVYDLKEDKNFEIPIASETRITWFPTSKHIFLAQSDKISIVEYDGTNSTDVYTGPFENTFAFPFPSGTKILVLTSIGKNTPPNLYAISLR